MQQMKEWKGRSRLACKVAESVGISKGVWRMGQNLKGPCELRPEGQKPWKHLRQDWKGLCKLGLKCWKPQKKRHQITLNGK